LLQGDNVKIKKGLQIALFKFAELVDRQLENPTIRPGGGPVRKYARAIERGSNDKARRADRNEALSELIEGYISTKGAAKKQ
jgi:hypothetical protein